MRVTVNEAKVRAEIGSKTRNRQRGKLTASEVRELVAKLSGDATSRVGHTNRSTNLSNVRGILGVSNDMELAYLAYERGYVTIDEGMS